MVIEVVSDLLSDRSKSAVEKLQSVAAGDPGSGALSALRLAAQRPGESLLYYQKLDNLWQRWGRPPLKPNTARRSLLLLSDLTVDGFVPLLRLFCGAWGIEAQVQIPAFDSVEQIALGGLPRDVRIDGDTIAVLLLSEQWLCKYLGGSGLVTGGGVRAAQEAYQGLLAALQAHSPRHVLLASFPPRAYPLPGGTVTHDDALGWNLARQQINVWLAELAGPNVHLVDLTEAIALAGGRAALGQTSYFRARMPYEPPGTIAVTRELASAVANLCGKSHRALVTDWDNTLWGGEVAELGSHGVLCGVDSPDGLAYYRVQEYLKALKAYGVLLAAVSRNDAQTQRIFEENRELCLSLDDFSAIRVGWGAKSQAIAELSDELGFGAEFMVFLDDSVFELVEAVRAHPYLDVLRAGPEPEMTLGTLCRTRFFNAVSLSEEDLQRSTAALSLKRQREAQARFGSLEDFLQSISIELTVSPLTPANLPRVVQMFEKTNQFNLTTRRHGEAELRRLIQQGGTIGVFSYSDAFGPQGIISVVNLLPEDGALRIESWLMSCRVLNRTVEQAVFDWMLQQADGRALLGEYIPTQRNKLVSELYASLGFEPLSEDAASGAKLWRCPPGRGAPPKHYARVRRLDADGKETT